MEEPREGLTHHEHKLLEQMSQRLEELHKCVVGNGKIKEGLVWKVNALEVKYKEQDEHSSNRDHVMMRIAVACVTVTIGAVISAVIGVML